MKKLLLALCAFAIALVTANRAEALSYRKVTDAEIKTMANRIIAVGTKSADDKEELEDLLEVARRVRPIVELVEAKCPMPIRVANGTNVPVFDVEISVSERRGSSGTRVPQVFHIPYLPAKSLVSGTVACSIPSYSFGYQAYGDRDIYMSASPIAEHARLDDAGIAKMLETNVDLSTASDDFSSSSADPRVSKLDALLGRDAGARRPAFDPNKRSVLLAVFDEIDDDDDFKFFVQGLLRSNEGSSALGNWVRTASPSASAKIAPMLALARSPNVRAMLEEVMKSPSSGTGAVVTAAVTRVCGPGQPEPERTSMWLAALGKTVKDETTRAVVLEKCGVGKDQTRARLVAAKPEQLGHALDGMTGDLFDVAVSAMTEARSIGAARTLLANTQSGDKFVAVSKAALSFVTPGAEKEELLRAVASGPSGSLDDTKAKWLSAELDELHANASDAPLLRRLLADMANGLVANAHVRKAVYARWNDAGKGAFDPFMTRLASRSHVLAPEWVRAQAEAGKLDLVELLSALGADRTTPDDDVADDESDDPATEKPVAKAAGKLAGGRPKSSVNTCHANAKAAEACLAAVRGFDLSKDAIDPAFRAAVTAFLRAAPHDEIAAKVATELASLGVDMSEAVDALCKASQTEPGRWGYGSGASDPFNTAMALNASHPCIATVKSARTSAERWIAAGVGFRVTLALVPFGFVGLFARKRFVPVRAQLAKESAELEAVRGRAAVTTRLAAPKTEEALSAGIADAAAFLSADPRDEVAGAGRALAALTPERRTAILGKTRSLATRAAESGMAATFLAELDGLVVYVACFPGREEQPQTVRRHPGFTGGWPAHVEAIVDACTADGRPNRVLSLLFMLGVGGEKATMLVGYDTPAIHLVPESLGPRETDVAHGHRYELALGDAS